MLRGIGPFYRRGVLAALMVRFTLTQFAAMVIWPVR